jgi:hypothetical protein
MPLELPPNALSIGLLALMVASTVRAFAGEPPAARVPRVAPMAAAAAAAALLLAAVVVGYYYRELTVAALLAAVAVEIGCFAGWSSRADDGRGGSGGPDEDEPVEPPPFDWEEFARQLREHATRSREAEPVGRR